MLWHAQAACSEAMSPNMELAQKALPPVFEAWLYHTLSLSRTELLLLGGPIPKLICQEA